MAVYLVYAMRNVRDGGMEVDHWCEENYIFENDILQDIDTGEYVVVQWFPEYFSFMVWRITINKIEFLYSFLCSRKLKVVGNVYDGQNLTDKENREV